MHGGLITSLSLYPIIYLNEFFVPCDSSLKTNILLTSVSYILVAFLFLMKVTFFICLSSKFTFFLLVLILGEKK